MPTTPQDIDALLTIRSENEHVEFKAAQNISILKSWSTTALPWPMNAVAG